jgi:hypothetical protein
MKDIIKLVIVLISFMPLGKTVAMQITPNNKEAIDKNKYPFLV